MHTLAINPMRTQHIDCTHISHSKTHIQYAHTAYLKNTYALMIHRHNMC